MFILVFGVGTLTLLYIARDRGITTRSFRIIYNVIGLTGTIFIAIGWYLRYKHYNIAGQGQIAAALIFVGMSLLSEQETAYLLKSDAMKQSLSEARKRDNGINFE